MEAFTGTYVLATLLGWGYCLLWLRCTSIIVWSSNHYTCTAEKCVFSAPVPRDHCPTTRVAPLHVHVREGDEVVKGRG